MVSNPLAALLSGPRLVRNTLFNLVGQVGPLAAAVVAIPFLATGLGTARFGLLALAWVLIGYFSIFDFGLGRALTQLASERLGQRRAREIPGLAWTALLLMGGLGVLGSVVLLLLTPWLVESVLRVPASLEREGVEAFRLLAVALPWVITTTALRGLLEAYQKFGVVNAIRLPLGLFTFFGPLAVLFFSNSLVAVVTVLVMGRIVGWMLYLMACLRLVPAMKRRVFIRPPEVRPLLRFGGWMTVSNLVSPLMTHLDRFLIGAVLSVNAVTYYAIPYEVATKLLLVPVALTGVTFPLFAAGFAGDRSRAAGLFDQGVRFSFLFLFPLCLLVILGAEDGLRWWLDAEFARNSTSVLQWLAVGILLNGVAQTPFAVVQGAGRPDLTGKLHLVELPLYLILLWLLVLEFGITGAAAAWTVRVAADAATLLAVAERETRGSIEDQSRRWAMIGFGLALLGVAVLPQTAGAKLAVLIIFSLGFGIVAWKALLEPAERAWIGRGFQVMTGRTRLGGIAREPR